MTFRTRLAATYAAIFAVSFAVLASGVYASLHRVLHGQLDDGLRTIAQYHHTVWPQSYAAFQAGQKVGPCVFYLENSGRVVYRTIDAPPPVGADHADFARALHDEEVLTWVDTPGGKLRVLITRLRGENGRTHVIEVAAPYAPVDEALRTTLGIMLALGAAALAAAVAAGRWLATRALGPVVDVTSAARAIQVRDLTTRLPVPPRRDEIGELVAVFNQMLARLATAFEAQQRFTADASHELRSPLTALRGELEVARRRPRTPGEYEAVLDSALEETERLERIINDLLALAQLGGATAGVAEPVDLGALCDELVARRRGEAMTRGLALTLRAEPGLRAVGVAPWLARAIDNLLANALRYTPAGEVTIAVRRAGGEAVVEVADTGPGIAPEQLERIFDRFHRADAARARSEGGVGLGLAIARQIARVHGGDLVAASTPGQGATFTLTLPVAAEHAATPAFAIRAS